MEKSIKNYIILLIIAVVTMIVVWALMTFYQKRKEYENSQHTRMDFLSQIKETELKNYMTENHDAIIYISNSDAMEYKDYEEQLKRLLIAKDMTKNVVYLNMHHVTTDLLANLGKQYLNKDLWNVSEIILPNALFIADGKIQSILYTSDINKEAKDVIYFIEKQLEDK